MVLFLNGSSTVHRNPLTVKRLAGWYCSLTGEYCSSKPVTVHRTFTVPGTVFCERGRRFEIARLLYYSIDAKDSISQGSITHGMPNSKKEYYSLEIGEPYPLLLEMPV